MLYFCYSIIEYPMRGNINPFPSSEYALLGLLYSGPAHGYELHKHITNPAAIGLIWGIRISNLYAQLAKLENKGWIKGVLQPGEDRPARTQFHLTENGKEKFITWLSELSHHPRDFRQEFLLRYYFLEKFKPEWISEVCSKQLTECQEWLKNIRRKQNLESKDSFAFMVVEFRASQITSMVEWVKWLIAHPPSEKNKERNE